MRIHKPYLLKRFNYLGELLPAAAAAFGVIFAVIGGFAWLVTRIDAKDLALSVMSTAALGIGAYTGGYVAARRRRKNGLLMGVLCGVFIFIVIVIISAVFSQAAESFSPSAKLIVTLVCAGIGGVVGVNSKHGR